MKTPPRSCLRIALLVSSLFVGVATKAATEINYWLWDNNQLASYQACAEVFEKQHPDIKIKITQTGWFDYWTTLNTAFVSGTAPDVFWDHLTRYSQFIQNNLLVDLTPLIARDQVPTDIYVKGLVALWGKDGKQYGLPKDWDTIGVVYNRAMLEQAGIDPKSLWNLDWNPNDGGSFGQVIAKLSIDTNGKNGLDPSFDPKNVKQYGLLLNGLSDGVGHEEWANFAASLGWDYYDRPWATHFHYDDPKLIATIRWFAESSLKKGFIVPTKDARQAAATGLFAAQKGALATTGSWLVHWFTENCKFPIGFAPLPKGPVGRRSVINGLADSIWIGSKHQEEAWQWVKFLASPEAQKIVGGYGVVFPAIPEATEISKAKMSANGVDVSAFVQEAEDPQGTFFLPISDHGNDSVQILRATFDAIFLDGADPAPKLKSANEEIEALFH
ncbi:MAG: sugar ABC transporter substrate-binding protein [Verrucomicrobia bacterium]|nr:sugar ABC transporter substrate-binding protein [Verrucomicrobiota bacterium]